MLQLLRRRRLLRGYSEQRSTVSPAEGSAFAECGRCSPAVDGGKQACFERAVSTVRLAQAVLVRVTELSAWLPAAAKTQLIPGSGAPLVRRCWRSISALIDRFTVRETEAMPHESEVQSAQQLGEQQ